MAAIKDEISKLIGAKPDEDNRQVDPGADLVEAAREVLRALFVSGSDWKDLRIAGDGMDSRARKTSELADALLLLLSGKTEKLYFFDAKNPDKHMAVDRKILTNPAFLASLRDGKEAIAPEAPSEYKKLINQLNGKYQKEFDEYRFRKALYEIKKMQQQGKELGRDRMELPEEAKTDLMSAQQEMTPELVIRAQKEREKVEREERLIIQGKMTEADFAEDSEEPGLTVAEKRRRAAFKVLNSDDSGRGEIIDAIAVLLACRIVAGKEGLEDNAELFDKTVGKVKQQPAFTEMTEEPERIQEKALEAAETPTEELKAGAGMTTIAEDSKARRAENVIFHEFVKVTLALRALNPAPRKTMPAQPKVPQVAPPKHKVPVPVRVLTMERRVDDD